MTTPNTGQNVPAHRLPSRTGGSPTPGWPSRWPGRCTPRSSSSSVDSGGCSGPAPAGRSAGTARRPRACAAFVVARIKYWGGRLGQDPRADGMLDNWKKLASANRITAVMKLARNLVAVEVDRPATPTGSAQHARRGRRPGHRGGHQARPEKADDEDHPRVLPGRLPPPGCRRAVRGAARRRQRLVLGGHGQGRHRPPPRRHRGPVGRRQQRQGGADQRRDTDSPRRLRDPRLARAVRRRAGAPGHPTSVVRPARGPGWRSARN